MPKKSEPLDENGNVKTLRTPKSKKKLGPRKIDAYRAKIEEKKKLYGYPKPSRPTKYDPEFHPADCIRMGKEGCFGVEMVSEWEISWDTLHEWCKRYPEFSDAYQKAQSHRTTWLIRWAKSGAVGTKDAQINSAVWSRLMTYDGQNTEERTVYIHGLSDCKTLDEMSKCAIQAFGQKEITAREAFVLTQLISTSATIQEKTETHKMLEEIKAKVDGQPS